MTGSFISFDHVAYNFPGSYSGIAKKRHKDLDGILFSLLVVV